jgi:hypothetical protein
LIWWRIVEFFCFLDFGGATGVVAVLSVMAVLRGDAEESGGQLQEKYGAE